ncbi:hypothetical protein G4228_011075 [Cervus hanglu yarkandensis]|nr:hypothetical protein G4228_011075 [Cervus hanglu yarkandensis]
MWFLFFHRGLIASSFTETHYLQDGTDISLIRNYTQKRETLKMTKYVELVIVADNREFYRPLNIRIVLVGVEVWNDIDKCSISQDPFTSLHEFLDWRKMKLLPRKSHDNAQLISGVYFQGTTIGMAPIMSMCTAEQSGGIVMGKFPFPMMFSSCSRKDLEASLEKGMGMCLFNLPEVKQSFGGQKCGNGYVEEGEECDCGEPEECQNLCCNATTCTLKPDAVCAHGLCCENCRLKPAGTACRDPSNACDLPEFCTGASPHCPANVYLHDGHPCQGVDGYCYNGICQTHEQQCVTLWGPVAAGGAALWLRCSGFLLWLLSLQSVGSRAHGLQYCGTWAQ